MRSGSGHLKHESSGSSLSEKAGAEAGLGLAGCCAGGQWVEGWEYLASRAPLNGAQLWARVRQRADQLARLENLSRVEFLVAELLQMAAMRATER